MALLDRSPIDKLRAVFASFAFRYMLGYVVALSAAVFIIMAALYASFSYRYFQENDALLRSQLDDLTSRFAKGESLLDVKLQNPFQIGGGNYYLLLDGEGRKVGGSLEVWPQTLYDSWFELKKQTLFRSEAPHAGELLLGHSRDLPGGYRLLIVRDYGWTLLVEYYLSQVLLRSVLVMIALGALSGIGMALRSVRNVDHINRSVARIMSGDFSERIAAAELRGDFKLLAIHFNQLLDRVQALMESMRQVSDNIAHDLRTPLTRVRNHLADLMQSAPPEMRDRVPALLAEADGLLATFNALLRIAHVESGQRRSEFRHVDLRVILDDLVELYEPLAMEKQQSVIAQIDETLFVMGDRDLLFQAFANLLDNAIKYTPPAGSIRIRAHREADGRAVVELHDTGEGIPEEDRMKVFRRFYRVEASRSAQPGNGLGLSLVAAVVRLHRAEIALEDGAPGLLVRILLPACQPVSRANAVNA